MNLFRTLRGAAFFALAGTGLSSCLEAPDYPVVPAIDFKEVRVEHIPAGVEDAVDKLTFVLDFRDGDGDLGLGKDDILVAPYNQPPTPGVPPRNHPTNSFNYFIQPFVKDALTKQFVPYITPLITLGQYDGTFPRLDLAGGKFEADVKPAPLKGELRYELPLGIDGQSYSPGQVMRFEITIMDRALNVSNTVTTSEVTLGR